MVNERTISNCPLCGRPCKEAHDGDSNDLIVCTELGLATSPCNYEVYAGCHEAICAEVARLKARLAKAEAVAWKLADAWENGVSAACEEDDPMGDPETFEKFYREAVREAVTACAAYVKEFPNKEAGR